MKEFLETYWDDIVEVFTKIYTYIKEWLIAQDKPADAE